MEMFNIAFDKPIYHSVRYGGVTDVYHHDEAPFFQIEYDPSFTVFNHVGESTYSKAAFGVFVSVLRKGDIISMCGVEIMSIWWSSPPVFSNCDLCLETMLGSGLCLHCFHGQRPSWYIQENSNTVTYGFNTLSKFVRDHDYRSMVPYFMYEKIEYDCRSTKGDNLMHVFFYNLENLNPDSLALFELLTEVCDIDAVNYLGSTMHHLLASSDYFPLPEFQKSELSKRVGITNIPNQVKPSLIERRHKQAYGRDGFMRASGRDEMFEIEGVRFNHINSDVSIVCDDDGFEDMPSANYYTCQRCCRGCRFVVSGCCMFCQWHMPLAEIPIGYYKEEDIDSDTFEFCDEYFWCKQSTDYCDICGSQTYYIFDDDVANYHSIVVSHEAYDQIRFIPENLHLENVLASIFTDGFDKYGKTCAVTTTKPRVGKILDISDKGVRAQRKFVEVTSQNNYLICERCLKGNCFADHVAELCPKCNDPRRNVYSTFYKIMEYIKINRNLNSRESIKDYLDIAVARLPSRCHVSNFCLQCLQYKPLLDADNVCIHCKFDFVHITSHRCDDCNDLANWGVEVRKIDHDIPIKAINGWLIPEMMEEIGAPPRHRSENNTIAVTSLKSAIKPIVDEPCVTDLFEVADRHVELLKNQVIGLREHYLQIKHTINAAVMYFVTCHNTRDAIARKEADLLCRRLFIIKNSIASSIERIDCLDAVPSGIEPMDFAFDPSGLSQPLSVDVCNLACGGDLPCSMWGKRPVRISRHFCVCPRGVFEPRSDAVKAAMESQLYVDRVMNEVETNLGNTSDDVVWDVEEFSETLEEAMSKDNKFFFRKKEVSPSEMKTIEDGMNELFPNGLEEEGEFSGGKFWYFEANGPFPFSSDAMNTPPNVQIDDELVEEEQTSAWYMPDENYEPDEEESYCESYEEYLRLRFLDGAVSALCDAVDAKQDDCTLDGAVAALFDVVDAEHDDHTGLSDLD